MYYTSFSNQSSFSWRMTGFRLSNLQICLICRQPHHAKRAFFGGQDRKMGHGFLGGEQLECYFFFFKGSIPHQNTGNKTLRLLYLCTPYTVDQITILFAFECNINVWRRCMTWSNNKINLSLRCLQEVMYYNFRRYVLGIYLSSGAW